MLVLMTVGYAVVGVLAAALAGAGVLAVLGRAPHAVEERLDLGLFATTAVLASGAGLVGAWWNDGSAGAALGSAVAVGLGVGAATCAVALTDGRLSRHPGRTALVATAVLVALALGLGPP